MNNIIITLVRIIMNIFNGYGFVTDINRMPEVIKKIDHKTYQKYYSFIKILHAIEPLYRTYTITQTQFSILDKITTIMQQDKVETNTIHQLIETQTVLYILANRMFMDNCKNFWERTKNKNLQAIIDRVNQSIEEKNMKLLRDYALHTSLPISQNQFSVEKNFKERKIVYRISATIDRNKMITTKYLSKEDIRMTQRWENGKLEIVSEIKHANKKIKQLMQDIVTVYLKDNVSLELNNKVCKDADLWRKVLVPYHTTGIVFQSSTGIPETALINPQLLAMAINSIIQ